MLMTANAYLITIYSIFCAYCALIDLGAKIFPILPRNKVLKPQPQSEPSVQVSSPHAVMELASLKCHLHRTYSFKAQKCDI